MSSDSEYRKWTAAELNALPDDAVLEGMDGSKYIPAWNDDGSRKSGKWTYLRDRAPYLARGLSSGWFPRMRMKLRRIA